MAKIGDVIGGKWKIVRKIDSGGQGKVYAATGEEGTEEVAIKIIKAYKPKKRARFIREVEAQIKLTLGKAGNIVSIIGHNLKDLSEGKTSGYYVMPMAINTLEKALPIFVWRVEICLEIFEGIVNGIKSAHQAGIIHRDIKPQNILFLDKSLKEPLIGDFGICFLKDKKDGRITENGETVGAKYFMAPEQERGGIVDVEKSADIYPLGKLLHHMLTERMIYREEIEGAFTEEEIKREPRLIEIHEKLLSKTIVEDPHERIQTANELLKIIRHLRKKNGEDDSDIDEKQPPKIPSGKTRITVSDKTFGQILKKELEELKNVLAGGEHPIVDLRLDDCKAHFNSVWPKIHDGIKDNPKLSIEAAKNLIRSQPKTIALCLAMARCDANELFTKYKRFLEFLTKSSEGQSGYPAVFTVPHAFAGFLFMSTSVLSLHHESWNLFASLLGSRFEWYYQSARPLYNYGFAHSYFFHPEALGRSSPKVHDFYTGQLQLPEIVNVTDLNGEQLLDSYAKTQMIMSLRSAQLEQRGEDEKFWPDFGRFYAHRVSPLLDRMYHDPSFAEGVLRAFGESKEEFFDQLNARLELVRGCFGGSNYWWSSLETYEPR
jgi:serine/threonine protein kinase